MVKLPGFEFPFSQRAVSTYRVVVPAKLVVEGLLPHFSISAECGWDNCCHTALLAVRWAGHNCCRTALKVGGHDYCHSALLAVKVGAHNCCTCGP